MTIAHSFPIFCLTILVFGAAKLRLLSTWAPWKFLIFSVSIGGLFVDLRQLPLVILHLAPFGSTNNFGEYVERNLQFYSLDGVLSQILFSHYVITGITTKSPASTQNALCILGLCECLQSDLLPYY